MMTRSLVLILTGLLLACASPITAPVNGLPFATASQSCGPADGPAVRIRFSATQDPLARPYLVVMIYERLDRLTGTWPLAPDIGFAGWVTGPNEVENARRGVVRIERVDESNAITGTVDLVFDDAGVRRGRFHAVWNPAVTLCG